MGKHPYFRVCWLACNALLVLALAGTVYTGVREYSVRQYLKGFSDAIVPEAAGDEQKAEAILNWMRSGPPRLEAANPALLSPRDPTDTLNYRQLLEVCGSATNAFLNLGRSSGLETRRLLLLSPNRTAMHVVAEVYLDGRWVVVDPTYRAFMRDAAGRALTRKELQNPELFQQATSQIPGYHPIYRYDQFAHIRISAIPVAGFQIRRLLDRVFPGWDDLVDWSLLLERRSFLYFFLSLNALLVFALIRLTLAWVADNRLRIPRFRAREKLLRATTTLFTTPEIK